MKKTFFYLFFMLLGLIAAKAQTPFDGFDKQMAGIPINKTKESPKFRIPVQDSTNRVAYLELNVEERLLGYYTHNDSLVAIARIEENEVKFLSVDPLTGKYPELTPYQFASNRPIDGIDLDGLEFYYAADGSYLGKGTKNPNDNSVHRADKYTLLDNGAFSVVSSTYVMESNEAFLNRAHLVYGEGGPKTYKATAHTIQNREDLLKSVNGMPSEYNFMDYMMAHGNKDVKPEEYFATNSPNSAGNDFAKVKEKPDMWGNKEKAAVSAVMEASTRDPKIGNLLEGGSHPLDPTGGAIEWRGGTTNSVNNSAERMLNSNNYLTVTIFDAGNGSSGIYFSFNQNYYDNKYPGPYNQLWNKSRGLYNSKLLKTQ